KGRRAPLVPAAAALPRPGAPPPSVAARHSRPPGPPLTRPPLLPAEPQRLLPLSGAAVPTAAAARSTGLGRQQPARPRASVRFRSPARERLGNGHLVGSPSLLSKLLPAERELRS